MSEIPAEFMERAAALRNAVIWQSNESNEVIARALMAERDAERERCANVEAVTTDLPKGMYGLAVIDSFRCGAQAGADALRAAIRAGGQ